MKASRAAQRFILSVLFAALLAAPPAGAEVTDPRELDRLEKERAAQAARHEAAAAEAQRAALEVARLKRQLVEKAKLVQQTEREIAEARSKLAGLRAAQGLTEISLEARSEELAAFISALLRLDRSPPPAMAAHPDDMTAALRSALVLQTTVPALQEEADTLKASLIRLQTLKQQIAAETARLDRASVELAEQRKTLAALVEEKRKEEAALQAATEAEARKLESVTAQATTLKDLIGEIEARARRRQPAVRPAYSPPPPPEKKAPPPVKSPPQKMPASAPTAAGKEPEPQAVTAPPPPGPTDELAPLGPPITVGELPEPHAVRDEPPVAEPPAVSEPARPAPPPEEQQVAALDPAEMYDLPTRKAPARGARFSDARGTLDLPVTGTLVRRFGQPSPSGGPTEGLTVRTPPGAQIVAPFDGIVEYAGPFRHYGQLLIISVGEGYHILLSGMASIAVNEGQSVLAGEPVARMGAYGAASPTPEALYIEIRRSGNPVDPSAWLR